MIADRRIATAYAIEALRVFDHLNFRDMMQQAENRPEVLRLQKPTAISGAAQPWFAKFYEPGGQRERDRLTLLAALTRCVLPPGQAAGPSAAAP